MPVLLVTQILVKERPGSLAVPPFAISEHCANNYGTAKAMASLGCRTPTSYGILHNPGSMPQLTQLSHWILSGRSSHRYHEGGKKSLLSREVDYI